MELSIPERLKDLRVERGLTLEQLAEQTHLSKSALGSYEGDNFKDISHYALIQLAKFYEVSVDYLLCRSHTKNHPNADLADLHLSDDMIEFLKSGLVDNSLLCELAAHPAFLLLWLKFCLPACDDLHISFGFHLLKGHASQHHQQHIEKEEQGHCNSHCLPDPPGPAVLFRQLTVELHQLLHQRSFLSPAFLAASLSTKQTGYIALQHMGQLHQQIGIGHRQPGIT